MTTRKKPPVFYKTIKKRIQGEYVYERTKVKPSEVKETIMKANKWTEEQYKKQFYLFRNKLKAYENYRKARGAYVKEQSPLEVLYRQAKTKIREGKNYEPSLEMKRIQSFSAVSITKGRRLAEDLESAYSRKRDAQFAATTETAFKDFIKKVPKAKEIMEKIKDPVGREEALKDLAEHVHAKQLPNGEVASGEAFGSDNAADDYNVDEWL